MLIVQDTKFQHAPLKVSFDALKSKTCRHPFTVETRHRMEDETDNIVIKR